MATTKKAWRTTWGGITSIIAAPTRGIAAARTMASATEVYGSQRSWSGLRVRRAPEYDAWAATDSGRRCLAEEYVRGLLAGEAK